MVGGEHGRAAAVGAALERIDDAALMGVARIRPRREQKRESAGECDHASHGLPPYFWIWKIRPQQPGPISVEPKKLSRLLCVPRTRPV